MRFIICAATLLAAVSLAAPGHAATLTTTLAGTSLSIDTPCARQVDIAPDPTLHNQAMIEATADNQEELDHLLLESRGAARVRTHPGPCWQNEPGAPATLRLSLRVPPGFALAIDDSGTSRYVVGPVGGAVAIDISGESDVHVAKVAALKLDLSGDGNVHVAAADGPAQIDLSGHADVVIGQATMPSLTLNISGAGQVSVASGHVGKVTLEASGVGSTQIGADVDDAHVELSGVGNVRFAKLSGQLEKEVSGVGSITVGH